MVFCEVVGEHMVDKIHEHRHSFGLLCFVKIVPAKNSTKMWIFSNRFAKLWC